MTNLAEAILRDVPRYTFDTNGELLYEREVLAALTAALDPALSERAGEVLSRLRKADEYEPLGHDGWDAADLITALMTQNAALRVERDDALTFLDNAVSKAPEPLKALGKYLAGRLDEDEWPTAEQYLNAAAKACADRAEAAEAQTAALTARVERLMGAAKRVLDPLDEPCRHDHHGYCQAHFIEAECSVAALRAALTAATEEGHE